MGNFCLHGIYPCLLVYYSTAAPISLIERQDD
jgi:hypothetical protein